MLVGLVPSPQRSSDHSRESCAAREHHSTQLSSIHCASGADVSLGLTDVLDCSEIGKDGDGFSQRGQFRV